MTKIDFDKVERPDIHFILFKIVLTILDFIGYIKIWLLLVAPEKLVPAFFFLLFGLTYLECKRCNKFEMKFHIPN